MKRTVKETFKKWFAGALAIIIVAGMLGAYLPKEIGASKVQAATPTDPAYMAKLTGTSWKYIMQTFGATPGTTYHLTFDYYSDEASTEGHGARATIWSSGSNSENLLNGKEGNVDLTYTAGAGDNWFGVRFELLPNATVYIWNVSVKAEGSDTELLNNGTFEAENGSWIGWTIDGTSVSDKTASDGIKTTYGYEIIPFDKTFLPSGAPAADPAYMAKLTKTDGKWIMQTFGATVGTKYHLTFDYYADEGSESGFGATAALWAGAESSKTLWNGTTGSVDICFTGDSDWFGMRFVLQPGATVYLWNISVKAEGSDTEFLNNGNFAMGNGSWIGWNIDGAIADKEASDKIVAEYKYEIIPYDKNVIPDNIEAPGGGDETLTPPVEKIPSGNPKYMAQLNGTYVDKNGKKQEWVWVYQPVTPKAGKTYTFSYQYYVASGQNARGVIWSSSNETGESFTMKSGVQGTANITYKATQKDDWMMIRFECEPETVCYVWNVCVYETGSDINLLSNGSFNTGDGSWVGWNVKTGVTITSKKASDVAVAAYGQKIVRFDSVNLPGETLPDKVPTGDPAYMAKLLGTYIDPDGNLRTYASVYQAITPEAGKTYIFSCEYYDRKANDGAQILLWTDKSGGEGADAYGRFKAKTQAGKEGKLELSYTAKEGETFLVVAMECDPDSEVYMWNMCLREKGSDINLLYNGSFEKENGTWIGWTSGDLVVTTKEQSKKLTETYGHQIVAFKRGDIEAMKEEDEGLSSYENPNVVFSFDDIDKYKELDCGAVEVEAFEKKDTTSEKSDTKGFWASVAGIVLGLVVIGGATGGIVWASKKRKKSE